jgi:hypothetical protein
MSTGIVLTFLALLLAGVLLILLGRRGRKINNHPQCTWCGFDLVGVYPGAVTCPECGAGLARTHGQKPVRQGVRIRQPIIIATGLALVLIAAAPLGLFTYAAITGTHIAKHLPIRGLELMANLGTQTRADEAAAELTDRLLKKSLDAEQSSRAVALVLAYQADANRPWTRPWADLLERVNLNALLTPEQSNQVIINAINPTMAARPTAARRRIAVVEITPGTTRLATNQQLNTQFTLSNWRINGTPQRKLHDQGLWMFGATPPLALMQLSDNGWWQLAGPSSNPQQGMFYNYPNAQPHRAGTTVKRDTPLGLATLSVELKLADQNFDPRTGSPRPTNPATTLTLSVPIKIVDTPDEVVQARTLTGNELEKFQKELNLGSVNINVSQYTWSSGNIKDREGIQFSLSIGTRTEYTYPNQAVIKNPDGAAFDAEVELDGETYNAGQLIATLDDTGMTFSRYWNSETKELLQLPKSKTATIRLKPSRELAETKLGMTWFHNAEIVVQDVPIRVNDQRTDTSKPLSELRGTSMQERMMPRMSYNSSTYPQSTKPDDTDPEDTPTNP